MSTWFGASWSTIGWVASSTAAMYLVTVVMVRLAGRRTVAQLSAYDVVVTIAIGSIIAGTVLSPTTGLVQGLTSLVTLLGLQIVLAWSRQRFGPLGRILDFRPEIVVRDGSLRPPHGLLTSQLTEQELTSLLRQQGVFDLHGLTLVILEPGGGVSVVPPQRRDGQLVPPTP